MQKPMDKLVSQDFIKNAQTKETGTTKGSVSSISQKQVTQSKIDNKRITLLLMLTQK